MAAPPLRLVLLAGLLGLAAAASASAQPPAGTPEPAAPQAPGRVLITHVLSDGEEVPVEGGAAVLPQGYRNLEVRYRLDGAPPGEPFRFRFRLEPVEDGWAEVGARQTAYYRNLDPGAFTLRVQALSAEGGWEREAALGVDVAPYLHERVPFRLALALLVAALALGGLHLRTRGLTRRAATLAALVDAQTAALHAEAARAEAARAEAEALRAEAEAERETARAAWAQAEAQAAALRRADGLKSRFFANVSHEVRTPLTLVLGALDEVLGGAYGPAPDALGAALAQAARNGRRVARLVDEMLDLARAEAGHLPLDLRPHRLGPLVREAVAAFEPLARRGGVALYVAADAADRLPPVLVDRARLEQVLFNVLSNALKATPAGGKVGVRLDAEAPEGAAPGGHVRATVRVQDTGPGISADVLPFVFERFFHADVEGARPSGGAGLGLAVAREIARALGGELHAASEPGLGSTFTLGLRLTPGPAPDEGADGAPADGGEGPPADEAARTALAVRVRDEQARLPGGDGAGTDVLPPTPAARPLVLVAEDNPEVALLLRHQLGGAFRVETAADGAEALALAARLRPALVLSDVVMPGVDGLALLAALRADPALAETPFVLLSARATPEDREAGLRAGADDYVVKPFHAAELRARLGNLIRTRRALRDHYAARVVAGDASAPVESADARLLERVYAAVSAHLADEAFSVEALAREAGVSQAQLKRKLRALADTSPVELIRTRRLDRAAELLAAHAGTVGEVAAAVGFGSASYFARCFRERFGVAPSAYEGDA